jgi:hypothetical protein
VIDETADQPLQSRIFGSGDEPGSGEPFDRGAVIVLGGIRDPRWRMTNIRRRQKSGSTFWDLCSLGRFFVSRAIMGQSIFGGFQQDWPRALLRQGEEGQASFSS